MADADVSLQILIKSVLDATGYRMNEAEAQKLKATLGETANSTGKLNEAVSEGGKAAEKSHLSHRALHQILHLIGREAGPAAGAAMSAFAAAATGGIMVSILAVRQLFEIIHEVREEAKRFKETMEAQIDISGLVGGIKDVKIAVEDTGHEIDKFFENLERKSAGKNGFKKIADDQIAHLQRVAEAEKKLAESEAEREKARLEILKATHKITEDEYKAGVKAADELKGKKESAIAGQLDSQSEAALHQAMVNILAQAGAARSALNDAKGQPNSEKHLETLKGLYEATQKRLEELEQLQKTPQSFWSERFGAQMNVFKHPFDTDQDYRQRVSDEIGARMNEFRGQMASLRRQMEDTKKNAPNKEKIQELEEKLSGLDSDKAAIEGELSKREDQGTVDKDKGTADFAQRFLEAQSRLSQRQGTRDDSQMVTAMNQLLQTTQQTDNRTFQLLKDLIAHKGNLEAALADLSRQMRNTPSMRGSTTGQ